MKSNAERIAEYKALYDEGIITREEFEDKKRQLLNQRENYGESVSDSIGRVADDESYLWLWFILGFFFQIVGLVLFIVWKDTKPRAAKYAGIGALVPIAIGIVFALFGSILSFVI